MNSSRYTLLDPPDDLPFAFDDHSDNFAVPTAQEYIESLQKFRDEVSAILGVSSPDGTMELAVLEELVKRGRDA